MCSESDCSRDGKNQNSWGRVIALFATIALVAIGSFGCGNDTPGQANCSSHDDCELGSVCGADDQCVQAKCSFCADDPELICLETDANPQGTCSKPECESNSECSKPGESCIDGQCLGSECTDDDDCDQTAGEICSAFNQCIIPDDTDTGTFETGLAFSRARPVRRRWGGAG